MSKFIVHEFDPVIYPRKVWITKGSSKDIISKIKENYRTPEDEYLSDDGVDTSKACVWSVMENNDAKRLGVLILLVENVTVGVAAHEAIHAANCICRDCNIHYDCDNDEHYAYLVQFITDSIWQTWTGKFKD